MKKTGFESPPQMAVSAMTCLVLSVSLLIVSVLLLLVALVWLPVWALDASRG